MSTISLPRSAEPANAGTLAAATPKTAVRPPGARRNTSRLVRGVRILSPLALVALWQAASSAGVLPTDLLASPATILRTGYDLAADGTLGDALLVSVQRAAIGFAVGGLIGVLLGIAVGLSRWADALLDPNLQMLRTLPLFALTPLLILWFGIGELPKLVLVAVASAFPLYLNTYAGIRSVDSRLLELSASLRLTRLERIRHVVLPGALPQILVGLRTSLGIAWISLVVAEQVNAESGLGQMIQDARDFLRTDVIVVGLVIYAVLGLGTDAVVRLIERRALAWRS